MKRALSIALLLASLGAATDARAQNPRAAARAIAEQGDEQFYAGRCDKAVPLWRRADGVYHAPTILLRVARCEALLGQVVAASATLSAIVAEALAADAPPAFVAAREEAQRDLARVRARVATLSVVVRGKEPLPAVEIEIDGAPAPAGAAPIPIDPGVHRVSVRAGGAAFTTEARLEDGEARAIEVPLLLEPLPGVSRGQRAAGGVVLGAGAVSLATGAGLGALALSTSHALDAVCGADRAHCPPSAQGAIDRARAYSLASDGALVAGGVLAAAGVVLLTADIRFRREPARVRIVAAPRGLSVAGELF